MLPVPKLKEDTTNRDLGTQRHTCRICGQNGLFRTWLVREMMQGTKEEFAYFACDTCGCLQIAEIPSNLEKYYGTDYYSFHMKDRASRKFSTPKKNMQKILDVGCGNGSWLLSLAEEGFGNLWGCDPFLEQDLDYDNCVHLRKLSIHEMSGNHNYDYIHMGNSFEHMTDPLNVLLSAKRLLVPYGILEITIPTFPNIAFDLFGAHWYQIDAPRHITLHSVNSIQYLARNAGLTIDRITYDSGESSILTSWFYQHGISYNEVYDHINHLTEYFSVDELIQIKYLVEKCNELGYGDHMAITMHPLTPN